MSKRVSERMRKLVTTGFAVVAGILVCSAPLHARITKIVIDEKISPAFCKGAACASYGDAGQYEQIAGRAFGELDPGDPLNKIIQDIALGKDPDGKVRYVATFVITKPVDMAKASGLMWHDVPNRGRPLTISNMERGFGDVGLASAWQGDNASMSAGLGTAVRPTMNVGGNHWLQVPVAKNPDGSPVTGRGPRPHRQPLRPRRAAVDRADQSRALYAGEHGYVESDARLARSRNDGRCRHRRDIDRGRRLEILRRRHVRCAGAADETAGADLSERRLQSGEALSGRVHRERSVHPRHRFRRVARCRVVLQIRGQGRCRHRESARRTHHAQHHARPLAVRQLPARLAASRLQSGRSEAPGARRHVAHHRGPPHRAQHPLGAAGRRAGALPGRQRRAAVVGAVSRRDARPAGAQHPRPLQRDEDLPENHRAFRRRRNLGTEARPRMGGHESEGRHPAARQRAPLLHRQHHARRRRGRLRHQPARRRARRRSPSNAKATTPASARCPPIRCRTPRRSMR